MTQETNDESDLRFVETCDLSIWTETWTDFDQFWTLQIDDDPTASSATHLAIIITQHYYQQLKTYLYFGRRKPINDKRKKKMAPMVDDINFRSLQKIHAEQSIWT